MTTEEIKKEKELLEFKILKIIKQSSIYADNNVLISDMNIVFVDGFSLKKNIISAINIKIEVQ